jgi:TolB protein
MQNLFRFCVVLGLLVTSVRARDIGEVKVTVENLTIPIRVTANSADLQTLALRAFNAHGRYDISGRRAPAYEFRFTAGGANQVRLDITKGSAASLVASQTVSGTSASHALLRAADVAVEKTNGLGLHGFFTARLTFLSSRTGKNEVYTSDLFPTTFKQLTHDRSLAMSPRWAPDGSRIIYTSYFRSGSPDIYLLDPVTGRKDTFASFRGSNWGARFSPNGQQVAMILTGEGSPEVYISDAHGKRPARRTRSDAVKSSPCWSPDGSQVVFAMEPGPQLYVMSAAGGSPRRISTGFSYSAEPDWNRVDRNKIACTVRVAGGKYQIAVVDLASGKGKVVSKAGFDGVEPSWLGDGRHLVYTARDRQTSVLCVLDTETGNSAPITPTNIGALQAGVWTPAN